MTRPYDALAVIAFISGSLCVMNTSRADEIGTLLDRIDTPGFLRSAADEKGYKAVREAIQARGEVKRLVERSAEAVPRIVQRIEGGDIKNPATLCAYFLILEFCGEQAGVPVLLDYVESVPRVGHKRLCTPWEPFRHAVEAIGELIGLGDITPDDESLCEQMSLRGQEIVRWAREVLQETERGERFGDIEVTLQHIDRADFCWWVGALVSDYVHVCKGVLVAPEVRYLLARPGESVPRIVERIKDGRVKNPGTLCVYFPILERGGGEDALPVLLDYVESLPTSEYKNVGATGHPFNCAIEAIYALGGLGPFPPRTEASSARKAGPRAFREMFLRRDEIVAKGRAVLEENN